LWLAVERAYGIGAKVAIYANIVFRLERSHRVAHCIVIERIFFVARDGETLAKRDDACILHAGAKEFSIGDVDSRQLSLVLGLVLRSRARAQLCELRLERLEARLRRVEAVEHLVGIVGLSEPSQHAGRFRRNQVILDVCADSSEMDSADLCMPRE